MSRRAGQLLFSSFGAIKTWRTWYRLERSLRLRTGVGQDLQTSNLAISRRLTKLWWMLEGVVWAYRIRIEAAREMLFYLQKKPRLQTLVEDKSTGGAPVKQMLLFSFITPMNTKPGDYEVRLAGSG